MKEGPANQSYGLQVAQLAGVPRDVIDAARRRLDELERESRSHAGTAPVAQLPLFDGPHPVVERLRDLAPDDFTPRQALDALYELKRLAER